VLRNPGKRPGVGSRQSRSLQPQENEAAVTIIQREHTQASAAGDTERARERVAAARHRSVSPTI